MNNIQDIAGNYVFGVMYNGELVTHNSQRGAVAYAPEPPLNYVFSNIYTMNSSITKEYINRIYDDMHNEQLKLMNAVKNGQASDDKTITKQTSLINTIMINLMRLRNEREKEGKTKNGLPAYMK